jgi:hypothetical protein
MAGVVKLSSVEELLERRASFEKNEEPRLPGALSPLLIFAGAEISCGGGKAKLQKRKLKNYSTRWT